MRHLARLAILGLGVLLSCTAVVNEDSVQCATDADCTTRGPDFVGSICVNDFCQAKPVVVAPPECTKNSDCKGMVCNASVQKCIAVESEDCSVVYGDAIPDGTVLFGLMSEVTQDDALYFREHEHALAAQLAFGEFFDKNGARFPGNRGAALVACSERSPRRAAAHLANIGVKAVIGPSNEGRQKAVVETLVPGSVPSFTPWINGNPARVIAGSAGLSWLVGFERSEVLAPLNSLLAEQEAQIKTQRSLSSVRVAVIVDTPAETTFNPFAEYGDLVDQRLSFNGKSAIENGGDVNCGNCYRRFATTEADDVTVSQRADDIVAFNPTFIIPFANLDWGSQLLPKLEEKYGALAPASRPVYLHPFLQVEDPGYLALPVTNGETRRRITGIRPLRDNSYEIFQSKYQDAFGAQPGPSAGRAYETSLLVLFATYAALVDKPDARPADVAAALETVTDRTLPSRVTLNDIAAGVQAVNGKQRINLDGLFSTFDFDRNTGTAPAVWTTWCVSAERQLVSGSRIFSNGSFGEPAFCE